VARPTAVELPSGRLVPRRALMGIVYHRTMAVKVRQRRNVNHRQRAEAGLTVAGGAANRPAMQDA
jgi:hypothetical protein